MKAKRVVGDVSSQPKTRSHYSKMAPETGCHKGMIKAQIDLTSPAQKHKRRGIKDGH